MFAHRDFDLNSVDVCTDSSHIYTDSLKEVFKNTMLNQEIIFQNQVHELHRLYGMQKMLTQHISWMEFDQYDLNKLGLAHSKSQKLLEVQQGLFCKLQQRPRSHELPSNFYTSHAGNVTDPDNLKLSLSIGEGNRGKERGKRSWFDGKLSQNVIDLEDSTEAISNEDSGHQPPFSCSASTVTSGSKHDSSQKSVLTDPTIPSTPEKDPSCSTLKKRSLLDDCKRNSFDQDLRCNGSVLNTNFSPKQQCLQHKSGTWDLDLNKVYCDESSCYSSDPVVMHPSTASSSHAVPELVGKVEEKIWIRESNNCSAENSGIVHPDVGNFTLGNSNKKYDSKEIFGGKCPKFGELSGGKVVLALEAVSRKPKAGPSEEFGCHKNDPAGRNARYTLSSKSRLHTCAATRAVNHEKKFEDDVISFLDCSKNTVKDGQGEISSDSCKPCHIGDDESSNAETRQQSEEESRNPLSADPFSGNRRGSQAPETFSEEQNLRSFDSIEINDEHLSEEESEKVYDLVQKAAESLIHISLESSACYPDHSVKDGGSTEIENNERATPQNSIDSFELLTLKLKDCSEDYLCVSSKPLEVDFTGNKDYGLKIRRGRRLKDFQKDILPGLASLSRHEIREDINILEGVLRSREYRKMQAKMADGNKWCMPARSRRSRLNYVARRRFS